MNPALKPPLKYRGGKSRELNQILPFVPTDAGQLDISGRYVEPFLGGGALYFALAPHRALVNDINRPLMLFYADLRDNYERMSRELSELEALYASQREDFQARKAAAGGARVHDDNDDLYYRLRDEFNSALHRIRQGEAAGSAPSSYLFGTLYYFINKTAYSGMIRYNKRGEYNVPYGRYKSFTAKNITAAHSDLLARSDIVCGSYTDVFAQLRADDFMFLDPPYDSVFHDYGNADSVFDEAAHRRLAAALADVPCRWTMAISLTPLTEELYGDRVKVRYSKNYSVNIRNRFKSQADHIIVTNW